MTDLSVILFPHSHITDPDLKKILAIFGQLTICQPWFMKTPRTTGETTAIPFVDILYPPVSMKPKGDIKWLLSEYQLWMRQNRDKGYTTFLGATQEMTPSENTPWEIRQMICRSGQDSSISPEDHSFQWHLILHLAREFEENRVMVKEMVDILRQTKSPLEEAIGEGVKTRDYLKDLSLSEMQLLTGEHHLKQVFEAWFGLFEGYLSGCEVVVTIDPHVMSGVTEFFEEAHSRNTRSRALPTIKLRLPDLSHLPVEEILVVRQQYPGEIQKALKSLIKHLGDQAGCQKNELIQLAAEVEGGFPLEQTSRQIHITLTNLLRPLDSDSLRKDAVLAGLSDKTIVLVEN